MRQIVLSLLMLASALVHAATPYTNSLTGPDVFYSTSVEACAQMIPAAQTWWNGTRTDGKTISYSMGYVSGSGICQYNYVRSDGPSGNSSASVATGVTAKVSSGTACVVDASESLTWPIGREEVAVGDSSFVAFGFALPPKYCFSGCTGDKDAEGTGQDFFGQPDSDPRYEVIFANIAYTLDGSTCSTGTNEPVPEVPDPPEPDPCEANPQAEGCTGGGDTGGGDTGGGDTGGGDTGGGDTGGGDTGGGDTGGGDSGGGDTGGGDTGGGDTGGGDSGGDTGSASGTDCGTSLSCSGDAVGCAIARIQKDFSCRTQEGSDFPAQKDALKQLLGDPQLAAEPDSEINVGELFNRGTRFLPAACPPPKSLSLITNGGRAFEISYDPLCQLATDLGYLIVVAASIFYAIYVGRAAGGE